LAVHDERSVAEALADAYGAVNAVSLYDPGILQGTNAGPTMSANDVLISASSVLPSPYWPGSPVH
jgi:hypothetical protein